MAKANRQEKNVVFSPACLVIICLYLATVSVCTVSAKSFPSAIWLIMSIMRGAENIMREAPLERTQARAHDLDL